MALIGRRELAGAETSVGSTCAHRNNSIRCLAPSRNCWTDLSDWFELDALEPGVEEGLPAQGAAAEVAEEGLEVRVLLLQSIQQHDTVENITIKQSPKVPRDHRKFFEEHNKFGPSKISTVSSDLLILEFLDNVPGHYFLLVWRRGRVEGWGRYIAELALALTPELTFSWRTSSWCSAGTGMCGRSGLFS